MTDKDNILSKWLQGEATDEEVTSLLGDIDLAYLKWTLEGQENTEISTTNPSKQWDEFESQLTSKPKRKNSNYLKWILIGLLISIVAGFLYLKLTNTKITIGPKSKEFMQYAFEDNSVARIWPGSEITFDKSNYKNNRVLKLEGEAFFEVTKGESFRVKTAAGEIEVLGTSFNVWAADKENIIVKCYTGRVRVSNNNKKSVVLTPGEQVSIENKTISTKSTFNVDVQKIDGPLKYYEKAKIKWVIDDLKKLYNIDFKINDQMRNQRFTGAISLFEKNEALSYLCEPMRWTYEEDNKIVTVKEK